MFISKKFGAAARAFMGIALVMTLLAMMPLATTAANNPEGTTLDSFPVLGTDVDTMEENSGTINTLHSGGTVKENKGTISVSAGTVLLNSGLINSLAAGHVGINKGTINYIEGSGSLSVNDTLGTVSVIRMGNVVDRNDGTIQDNIGIVSDNYGTITNNYGTVILRDGKVQNNCPYGTVRFEAKIVGGETVPAKGTVEKNEGTVKINSGTVTVKENVGNMTVTNATVTVEKNAGNITVGANATLICGENESDGVIKKTAKSAVVSCATDNGLIQDETAELYEIVFVGDDGKAVVVECDKEIDGGYYAAAGSAVFFTLPPEYTCEDALYFDTDELQGWAISVRPEEGDTSFTIVCHKSTTEPTATNPPVAELSATITAPIAGEKPDYTATAGGSGYTSEVYPWYVVDGDDFSPIVDDTTVFEVGKKYVAVVWFEPLEGIQLSEEATATVNGVNAELWSYMSGGARSYFVMFTVPEAPTEPSKTESSATTTATETKPSITVTEPTTTATEAPIAFLGDANGDGAVNMKDVLTLRKQIAGMTVFCHVENADVNEDGDFNMKDVLMLRKFLANIIDKLGA